MTTNWEFIADCLRHELAEYGGMLHLFENQQRSLFARDSQAVMTIGATIEGQARSLAVCRSRREQAVADFAAEHGQPRTSTLRELLPLIDANARPLLEALIDEVNSLLHRVRRVSRHNYLLLTKAVDVHQELLQHLRPTSFTKTYSPSGVVSVSNRETPSTLLAAG